jgi:cellulose synthase/poly-beta-1,6-N-acetylglucosamine synthase-like glycosyltransferase
MNPWYIIFWASLLLIVHSYVLYPWLLHLISLGKRENELCYDEDAYPPVTILMSAYNEEKVIAAKLDSIMASAYPPEKITVITGSDASNDRTNEILVAYAEKDPRVKPVIFKERRGKPGVINQLTGMTGDAYIIMTDANVMFHRQTIPRLMRHFRNPEIGIVGGNVINETVEKNGVSIQEKAFMSREILMKYREGITWGATIGVEGSVYAIRKELYTEVPRGFAVDDFFISMNVLRKRKQVILDINAITYEDVPNLMSEEYRRKVRIATGNYRNLRYFGRELLMPWKGASFAYISHKVIRWLGPFIILLFMLSNILLYPTHQFYEYTLLALLVGFCLPIIDFFLSKIGIHIVFLRFVRHFVTMNIALIHGFINNLGGIRKDVWQPTNR